MFKPNNYIHTHPFNGPFSWTTRVSQHQKGKSNLDFTEARDSEWPWHQLDHMQVCTLLQTDNHTSTPPFCFFTGRMRFLLPNRQCQSTEGLIISTNIDILMMKQLLLSRLILNQSFLYWHMTKRICWHLIQNCNTRKVNRNLYTACGLRSFYWPSVCVIGHLSVMWTPPQAVLLCRHRRGREQSAQDVAWIVVDSSK